MSGRHSNEPIAIVGSGCRFAGGASSPAKLWELLKTPVDVRSELPESRFQPAGFYHPDGQYHGHSNVRHGYTIPEHPGAFDAQFFGIKPVEAKALDPQQRLLLEVVYEALEAAGIAVEKLRGSDTGVYVGIMSNDYEALMLRDAASMATYHTVGTQRSIAANRISYFYDWHGPSMTVDTACSSSLVAVHLAARTLRSGEARTVLACGSNLLLGPENFIGYSKMKMLSPDGRSKMWDEKANGYARGEGVAALVLKTLSAALEDNDHIECVIRETGTNQDGATAGITMPSAASQLTLIRDTYRRAHLDPRNEEHRCQYFEAHGTGTQAGDPVEAEAIHGAFFDNSSPHSDSLYVGSIKTVVGHTEGAAGVASILKASLALQNGLVPPNLSFDRLNPRIAPFYKNLRVPALIAKEWPAPPHGQPRRASVNSFGFGGANAHVILESFDAGRALGQRDPTRSTGTSAPLFTPFVFSAHSEKALRANLAAYSDFLTASTPVNLHDLAGTLRQRRSSLPVRLAIPATSVGALKAAIDAKLQQGGDIGIKSPSPSMSGAPDAVRKHGKKILGVFTGQGAQYPRMGAELVEKSPFVRELVRTLDGYLSELPAEDRPAWSLESELLADSASSRVHEAAVAQPLCTAVQIVLVELLRLAGVGFSGVVGHSSGEIAATYAAGYLSARDAMRIAYYRGLQTSRLADGPTKGAMLAVGMSYAEGTYLCAQPHLAGKLAAAASNSAASITLSGDEDAITAVEDMLTKTGTFKRRLRVDQAYHSHHMLPCAGPYLRSLETCRILVREPSADCFWFSSTRDDDSQNDASDLAGKYWVDNMVNPVLFSQAMSRALSSASFDLALEIGPHPALQGPAKQVMQDVLASALPYSGTLKRDTDSVQATSDALGFLWSFLGKGEVDLGRYEKQVGGTTSFRPLKGLPTYQWDHSKSYWHEGRISRSMRLRGVPVHPLLGDVCPDSAAHDLRWRNILRVSELPWLPGHQLQGQVIFPAAGYLATALEAALRLPRVSPARMVEIRDLEVHHPLVFDSDDAEVEVLITLTNVKKAGSDLLEASFSYSAGLGKEPRALTLMASAIVEVTEGQPTPSLLLPRPELPPNMIEIDRERFYSSLASLGYNYSGTFRSLASLSRKLGYASGLIENTFPPDANLTDDSRLVAHPAVLDSAIQSLLLAHSHPADGQLFSLHVPTSISRVRVNPPLCGSAWDTEEALSFRATSGHPTPAGFTGDVKIYGLRPTTGGVDSHAAVQIEGVKLVPLAVQDTKLFSRMVWGPTQSDAAAAAQNDGIDKDELEFAAVLERMVLFYLRKFDKGTPPDHPARATDGPLRSYLDFARRVSELVESGRHKYAKLEWLQDTEDKIVQVGARFSETPDAKIINIIGQQMARVFRGETTILEQTRPNNLLDDYYVNALGLPQTSRWLARTVSQIAHRYPRMNILEVGAGTGGASKSILHELGQSFSSYTFSDVSPGFFEKAATTFAAHRDRMVFKTFDAERDPVEQGFAAHAYDLVVASFVIHATSNLQAAMSNVRRLLRPGGWAVLAEITDNEQARTPFIFGTLPGWWVGVPEGRTLSPCVSLERWDTIFTAAGFSGIDSATPPDRFTPVHPFSVLVTQAVDDRVSFLRNPLSMGTGGLVGTPIENLVIVGGNLLRTKRLVSGLKSALAPFVRTVDEFKTLQDVVAHDTVITAESTVISLVDLEKPVFKDVSRDEFAGLKQLFGSRKTMVWVTQGRRGDDPYANMTVGFGRTAVREVPELRLQFVDVEGGDRIDARSLAETVLCLQMASIWTKDGASAGAGSLLWSVEPELVIDRAGDHLAPRVQAVPVANARYNASRLPVSQTLHPGEHVVEIRRDREDRLVAAHTYNSFCCGLGEQVDDDGSIVQLHATLSLASAIRTPLGYRYLTLGVDRRTGKRFLALAGALASIVSIPTSSAVPWPASSTLDESQLFSYVAAAVVAKALLESGGSGQTLLVHDAPAQVVRILATKAAAESDVKVVCTTSSDAATALPPSCTRIPPSSTLREVKARLPRGAIDRFVGLARAQGEDIAAQRLELAVMACLPPECSVETAASILASSAPRYAPSEQQDESSLLRTRLARAVDAALAVGESDSPPTLDTERLSITAIADIAAGNGDRVDPWSFVSWTAPSPGVTVPINRLDSELMFRGDKTYWLIGLTGTLGLSLCDWMISSGAKYLAISSRDPKVDPAWIQGHKEKGVEVHVFSNDITSYDEVKALYERIRTTLPPLAGVAQGAMVLRDKPIRDMSFEHMTDVLAPKVDGSAILDRVLGDQPLDFLVFFSSILSLTGNIGQANYTAANAFMTSLAAQRRQRGLAASVVHIGVILGVGFVTRAVSAAEEKALGRSGLMYLSERDMHAIFAEGVAASRPDQAASLPFEPDLAAGLREVAVDSAFLPAWTHDPKFARFLARPAAIDEDSVRGGIRTSSAAGGVSSVKERLQAAATLDDAKAVMRGALADKLRSVLQMDNPDHELVRMRTDEIGLDSLVAVDIRSWLLQYFETDVPVLRLLGGVAIEDLIADAVESMYTPVSDADTGTGTGGSSIAPSSPPATASEPGGKSSSLPSNEEEATLTSSMSSSGVLDVEEKEDAAEPRTLARSLPMSSTQSLFWVVDSFVEDKTAPNHTVLLRIVGWPRVDALRNAVEAVGRHHEALRTCFYIADDQGVRQGVLESPTLKLEYKHVASEADVTREYEALKRHVYDLGSGRLMRIVLLSQSVVENWLLVGFHHINVDGLSYQVLLRDLDTAYRGQALSPRTLQYPDFANQQRAALEGGAWADDIAYWKREFSVVPEPLPLTRARVTTRRALTHFDIHTAEFRVDAVLARRIRDVAHANKATSFHFYLTAFQVLLHRLTGVEDLVVGIADGGRNHYPLAAEDNDDDDGMAGMEKSIVDGIGPYLNLVPLRFEVTGAHTFGRLIADARSKSYAGLAHARVPFEVLLRELQVARSAAHSPLFQAFVDYRQGSGQERAPLGGCSLEMCELQMGSTGYDLSLDVIDNPEGSARVAIMGQASLYAEADVRVVRDVFEDILHEFVQSPSKRIAQEWQYRQADVQKAMELGQGEMQERKWPTTLVGQFEAVVSKHGNKVALIHADGISLTYGQMQQRIETIAATLLGNQVKPGDSVGIFQESTPDWVCSMLAVWKVGAVFVPLDPGTKTERLAMVADDCKPRVILTDDVTKTKQEELKATQSVVLNVSPLADAQPGPRPISIRATPDGLAMIYYTSGSTGTPKGIPVNQEGLRAVFEGACQRYEVDESVVSLLQSSLGFDISLIQMFIAWPVGGTVCMISRDMRGDSVALMDFAVRHGVTHTTGTPSEYNSWLRFGDQARLRASSWRAAICGAEAFPMALLERLRELGKQDLKLHHIYGTTETTIFATTQELNWKEEGFYKEGQVPAGFSLPNKAMYVVDKDLHLLPIGLPGEIVLAGVGVAPKGYNNNDALTKSCFVPNIFATEPLRRNGWTSMYRTRDRGRLLPDGSIVVEGRIGDDTEIKLRGQRIDLKDVEATIVRCAHGVITEAVASVRSTAGTTDTQFLVAHVVISPTRSNMLADDPSAFLRDLLAGLPLPRYMCPTVLVPIEKMPMTMSSKLDRRAVSALPVTQPERSVAEGATSAQSMSEDESQLKSIWEEVIPQGLFDVTRESDFFHVGGTSLLLVQLQAQLHARFGLSIRLADLFANSTLQSMAQLVASRTDGDETLRATIDWEWETRPSADLQIGTAPPDVVPAPAANPKSVLITGGAGFLGRALLRSAIDNPAIERVHAVAVRQLQKRLASGLLPTHPKVIYYDGDLREPRVGLSEEEAERVFADIDAVIHNGADVSHLKSYFTLRRANVNATKELARLCLPRRIPFHYVSTAGVSMFTFWQSFGEETAGTAQPPTDGTNGYKASKWASEQFLERLNERLGLPVWLHRPSDMVRDDDDEASWDLLHTLLGYSRVLRAVPLSENLWGWLDLVNVRQVSGDVVQMVVDNKPRATDAHSTSYVHHTGDMAIPIDEMKEFFEEECGGTHSFAKVPIEEWARLAEQAGMRPAVAAVFANVPRLPRALCFPRFVKTWRPAPGQDGGMLLVRRCRCGEELSPVWSEGCELCGCRPLMPKWS